jgi:hypothetical protein
MEMLLGIPQHVILTSQQAVLGTGNLRKQGVVMWTRFILLRTGSTGWLLWI